MYTGFIPRIGKGCLCVCVLCLFTESTEANKNGLWIPPSVHVPYSGNFSPGKFFAKASSVVLRKNFARSIFAHM